MTSLLNQIKGDREKLMCYLPARDLVVPEMPHSLLSSWRAGQLWFEFLPARVKPQQGPQRTGGEATERAQAAGPHRNWWLRWCCSAPVRPLMGSASRGHHAESHTDF